MKVFVVIQTGYDYHDVMDGVTSHVHEPSVITVTDNKDFAKGVASTHKYTKLVEKDFEANKMSRSEATLRADLRELITKWTDELENEEDEERFTHKSKMCEAGREVEALLNKAGESV